MKVVILAGGLGTRLAEETQTKPKPMVEIGGRPILWHIMKLYSHHGLNDFIICCGFKGYAIKEYFANYFLHMADVTIDMSNNKIEVHECNAEPWRVTLVDTGEASMTGGRLARVKAYLSDDEPFCMTYGDGLSDINISEEIEFHSMHGKLATVAAVMPPGRFGTLKLDGSQVKSFAEKPVNEIGWINGGFFVLSKKCLDFIDGDLISWEQEPLSILTDMGELSAFKHRGFWQPMDTIRDKNNLEDLWNSAEAPWKKWQ